MGAANKNIGDAFLLVWRFPDKFYETDEQGQVRLKEVFYVNNLADLSLIGVIKTIMKLNTNLQILYYRKNEKLNKRIAGIPFI
jgi:HD-like signal output (HDOD) protein